MMGRTFHVFTEHPRKVCFFLKYEKIERDITFAFKDLLETVKTFPFLYFMFTLT